MELCSDCRNYQENICDSCIKKYNVCLNCLIYGQSCFNCEKDEGLELDDMYFICYDCEKLGETCDNCIENAYEGYIDL